MSLKSVSALLPISVTWRSLNQNGISFHRLLCFFRWCVAEPCYQYQWVVRDGDVFCQRSDGLRVDSKTALYFSLINKIMFSISSTRPTLWEQKEWDLGRGRSKKCRQQTGEPRNIVTESSVVLTSPRFVNNTLNSHDLVSSFINLDKINLNEKQRMGTLSRITIIGGVAFFARSVEQESLL